MKIVIPQQPVLRQYRNKVSDLFERLKCLEEEKQLASLRDFLLPMLMNGQVKVGNGVTNQENVVRYDFSGDQSRMMVAEESLYEKKD